MSGSNTSTENRNYELHKLYFSQIIIRMIKEMGHTAYTAERVAHKVFNLAEGDHWNDSTAVRLGR